MVTRETEKKTDWRFWEKARIETLQRSETMARLVEYLEFHCAILHLCCFLFGLGNRLQLNCSEIFNFTFFFEHFNWLTHSRFTVVDWLNSVQMLTRNQIFTFFWKRKKKGHKSWNKMERFRLFTNFVLNMSKCFCDLSSDFFRDETHLKFDFFFLLLFFLLEWKK